MDPVKWGKGGRARPQGQDPRQGQRLRLSSGRPSGIPAQRTGGTRDVLGPKEYSEGLIIHLSSDRDLKI